MNIFLHNSSSWLSRASHCNMSPDDYVNFITGDGQSQFLPASYLVATSSFLRDLLPSPCPSCCPNIPTICLPNINGFAVKMLAELIVDGETATNLSGELLNNCFSSFQEVLDVLEIKVNLTPKALLIQSDDSLEVVMDESIDGEHLEDPAFQENANILNTVVNSTPSSFETKQVREENSTQTEDTSREAVSSTSASFLNYVVPDSSVNLGCSMETNDRDNSNKGNNDADTIDGPFCCGKRFRELSSLIFHKKKHHSKEKAKTKVDYNCDKCTSVFPSKKSLARHFRSMHSTDNVGKVPKLIEYISGQKDVSFSQKGFYGPYYCLNRACKFVFEKFGLITQKVLLEHWYKEHGDIKCLLYLDKASFSILNIKNILNNVAFCTYEGCDGILYGSRRGDFRICVSKHWRKVHPNFGVEYSQEMYHEISESEVPQLTEKMCLELVRKLTKKKLKRVKETNIEKWIVKGC